MKVLNYTGIAIATSLVAASAKADDVTNRFSLSARFGLNISAKFERMGGIAPITRRTPDGTLYNYEDGYILTDSSGNAGGMTWNWGYDDSAQIDSGNNTVALSRSSGSPRSNRTDDDCSAGLELVYNRQIGAREKMRYGLEVAGNFLNIGLNDTQNSAGMRVTDFYSYFPGTTPPLAPYQGTFNGPGFVIFTNITSSITNSTTFSDRQKFDGDLWGFRVGPYLEFPISDHLNFSLSGGLAVGILDADVSWRLDTSGGTPTSISGHGRDTAVLLGGYVGGTLAWEFAEDWTLIGGAQYQSLGTYRHSFDGRKVELDLGGTVFLTVGLGYTF